LESEYLEGFSNLFYVEAILLVNRISCKIALR